MPRTNYVPDMHRPVGYAMPYLRERTEDKPTVEVDVDADGLLDGLIEVVCMALELWDPVFDHWEDPPPNPNSSFPPRQIPVFRGRHADKVRPFMQDLLSYTDRHAIEADRAVIMKIANKYVHIRPIPRPGYPPKGHFDYTPYVRETIRPLIRPSDPEWEEWEIRLIRRMYEKGERTKVAELVVTILERYDAHHATAFKASFIAELNALWHDMAPKWEFWRLVCHYVQDIADTDYALLRDHGDFYFTKRPPVKNAKPKPRPR
jgi:hypothetical protein